MALPITTLTGLVNVAIPEVYQKGMSYYEVLTAVVNKVNELIERSNDYFSDDVQSIMTDILTGWKDDGTLDTMIADAVLDIGLRSYTEQNYITDSESITSSLDALDVGITAHLKEVKAKISNKVGINEYADLVVGDDWSPAFQAAIDSEAGEIVVPVGQFKVKNVVIKSRTKIVGAGMLKTELIAFDDEPIFTWSGLTDFIELSYMTFKGDGSALSNINSDYLSTAHIHHCDFQGSLTECIYGNMILCDIENNLFGYYGTAGISHRHIYSKGVTTGNTTNINRITNNRFYRAKGTEAVFFEGGYQVTFEGNNFELNNCTTTIRINGMYLITFDGNWFENNAGVYQVMMDEFSGIGNYIIKAVANWFGMGGASNSYIFWLNGASNNLDFINNAGTGFNGKQITRRYNDDNSGIKTYYNNNLTGYTGTMKNKLNLTKPRISSKGFFDSAWLEGWTVSETQGLVKSAMIGWSQGTTDGYPGNSINYTASGSGYNFIYKTLPVKFFRGKQIAVKAIASKLTGSGGALGIAINTDLETPTNFGQGGDFDSVTPTEVIRYYDIPADADYLHIGLGSGGWTGTGQILAFDVWVVNGEIEPDFAK